MRFPEICTLETPRLVLRKLTESDIPAYYTRLGSSEAVTRYMLFDPHADITESVASIQKALLRYEAGRCYRWGIALKADNCLIGILELLRFDEEKESCSFAYMLAEDCWGKGYGSEALKKALDFAFREMEVQEVRADHFACNGASGGAMKKAGMSYRQTLPEKYEKHGIRYDAEEYGITRKEWFALS